MPHGVLHEPRAWGDSQAACPEIADRLLQYAQRLVALHAEEFDDLVIAVGRFGHGSERRGVRLCGRLAVEERGGTDGL